MRLKGIWSLCEMSWNCKSGMLCTLSVSHIGVTVLLHFDQHWVSIDGCYYISTLNSIQKRIKKQNSVQLLGDWKHNNCTISSMYLNCVVTQNQTIWKINVHERYLFYSYTVSKRMYYVHNVLLSNCSVILNERLLCIKSPYIKPVHHHPNDGYSWLLLIGTTALRFYIQLHHYLNKLIAVCGLYSRHIHIHIMYWSGQMSSVYPDHYSSGQLCI